ncbi:unnamed protein product [Medioppia subpectinata]|uniref:Uncharacterized protein n=1 Tax=Medioppia subpectinata TaxID=1979941 RepID=A0A7R9KIK6_9ACAR|nr:unnamed protein product [Medioppia subpectinata]CAG2104034.1 unnamed protein product [Medioppia subpectinata]
MGYEITRFESTVDDELICSICEGVLQNPIQVVTCEHVFCSDCLEDWLDKGKHTCPLDREQVNREDLKTPRIVSNLLAKLSIKCDFADYGCQVVVKLENLAKHLTQCAFNPNTPMQCEKGCGLMLANRAEFEGHNCMEKLHALVRGQSEQLEAQQRQISELRDAFVSFKSTHKKFDDEINKMRQTVSSYEFKMSVEQNKTQKLVDCMANCAKEMQNCQNKFKEYSGRNSKAKSVCVQFKDSSIDVDPYQRIGELKQNLMKLFNIRTGKLKLFRGSDELEDLRSIMDYSVNEVPDPRLSLVQCDEVQVFVKIRVMNSKENMRHPYLSSDFLPKTVALRIDRNGSIGQLKAEIRLIHNIQSEEVLLTYGTITLEDDHNLNYYNITDGSFINYYAHL